MVRDDIVVYSICPETAFVVSKVSLNTVLWVIHPCLELGVSDCPGLGLDRPTNILGFGVSSMAKFFQCTRSQFSRLVA